MTVDLTLAEIDTLLESVQYSKMNIREASGTPNDVRQVDLAKLDVVETKLRKARGS